MKAKCGRVEEGDFFVFSGLLDRVGESDPFVLSGLLDRVGEGDVRVLCECCGGWGRCRCAIFSGGGEMT